MSPDFGHHTLEYTKDGVVVTLFVRSDYYELAKELSDINNIDDSSEIKSSIMDYLNKNLPGIKINLIKIVAGTFLVGVINVKSIQKSFAGVNILDLQTQIQKAINSSADISIIVDKKKIDFPQSPFILKGTTYVPIREICEAIGITVSWDQNSKAVILMKDSKEIKFVIGSDKAIVDGTITDMPISYLVNKKTMVPIRFLSEKMGLTVVWDSDLRLIIVSSKNETLTADEIEKILPGKSASKVKSLSIPYSDEDLYWLSRIVNAEAKGESYSSKLAVACVIINRAQHPDYPDTIKEVVFDNNHGVQFQPVSNGSVYEEPSTESVKAAESALNGNNIAPGALFFLNPKIISNSWIIQNRRFAFQLENHDFYY